jgi:hypothetical protein
VKGKEMETLVLTNELQNWKLNIVELADRLVMGPQREALEQVNTINNRYGLNLGITRTYRWSPGYMDQIKEYMATKYLEPHMKRKMSTYFNQIDNKGWTYKGLRDLCNNLDETLYSMRARRATFQDNGEVVERVWNGIVERLTTELEGKEEYYKVYIGNYKFTFNQSWRPNEDQTDKPALIFQFYLPDTHLNYFIGNKSYPIPIYQTIVTHVIDLDDFIYRASANTDWIEDPSKYILSNGRSYGFTRTNRGQYNTWRASYNRKYVNIEDRTNAYGQLLHPFISSEEWTSSREHVDGRLVWQSIGETYRHAYACMGDYQTSLVDSMRKLSLGEVYATLYNWHTVYNATGTHPMNNISRTFFGMHEFMADDDFQAVVSTTNPENCRIAQGSGYGDKSYCDEYECLLRSECNYYNYDPDKAVAEEDDMVSEDDFREITEDHESIIEEHHRIDAENNIHGGEIEETTIAEQMIAWASQRGGAINIVNNERNENG